MFIKLWAPYQIFDFIKQKCVLNRMYRVVEKTNLIAHIFGKLSLPVISSSHAIIWEIGGGPWCGRTRVVSSLPREKLTSCAWGVFCHGEQMGAAATCRPAADVRWSCFSLFLPYLPNFLWVEHLLIFYKACWEQLVLKPVKNMCVCCLTHLTPKSSSDRKWLVKNALPCTKACICTY